MRSVLITGTSSGFGLLTSVELARRGWKVVATMRNPDKRAALEAAATKAGVRDQIVIGQLDVTEGAGMAERIEALLAATGGSLDAVVSNAGIAVAGAFEDVPEADVRRVMEVNFFGALALTRALMPVFRAQRRGRIVYVSSDSAFAGEPTNSAYCASKFALEGFAESLAYEASCFGIDIVVVEPGPYRTSILKNSPRLRPAGTAYGPFVDKLWPAFDTYYAKIAGEPQVVATAIAQALEARRPRFRTTVGPEARGGLFARGKIPSPVIRWGISRYFGLHKVKL